MKIMFARHVRLSVLQLFSLAMCVGCFAETQPSTIPTGCTWVHAEQLQADSAGNMLTGTITFTPALADGTPISYRTTCKKTSQAGKLPVTVAVTDGSFGVWLPDTTATNPRNVNFIVFARSSSGASVLGSGYTHVQPHTDATSTDDWCQAGDCNIDNYVPGLTSLGVSVVGPNRVDLTTKTPINGVLAGDGAYVKSATSADVQTLIGAGVYDYYGAALASLTTAKNYSDVETTRAKAAESVAASSIAAEATRALVAEQANTTAITAETARAQTAEGVNAAAAAAAQTVASAALPANGCSTASGSALTCTTLAAGAKILSAHTTTTTVSPSTLPYYQSAVTKNNLQLEDGYDVQVRPSSTALSKVLVLAGSSVCGGQGSTAYANSWAGRLSADLVSGGWTVYNESISGNSGADIAARFWLDIAPLHPQIILYCWGISNSGYSAYNYEAQAVELARLAKSIGATPIFATQYANGLFASNSGSYAAARATTGWLENLGIAALDLWSIASESDGSYIASSFVNTDNQHPTDAGHAEMYKSINPAIFDRVVYEPMDRLRMSAGAWKYTASSYSPLAISVTPSKAASSYTIAAWIKDGAATGVSGVYVLRSDGSAARIRNVTGVWELTEGTTDLLASSVSGAGQAWHHLALSYTAYTNTYHMWIDGSLVGSAVSATSGLTVSKFGFLFSASVAQTSYAVSDAVFYLSPKMSDDIQSLYYGFIPRAGLEFADRFNIAPAAAGAPTYPVPNFSIASSIAVAGTWAQTSAPTH